jgi:protein-disulfide isomerase
MNFKLLPLLLMLLLCSPVLAQKSKRRGTVRTPVVKTPQPQPVPQPPATAKPVQQPTGPTSLVIINGQTLTTADLPPALRQELERLEEKIAQARASVLDQQINTLLLQAEARKRGINTPRLYELEVTSRIPAITQAQINKFIEDNRQEFERTDPAVASQQVSAYLREEAENKLADDLVRRLRKAHPVVMGVDINSANLSPNAVVATVAGFPLKADALIERLKPIIYKLRLETYELAKKQTDQLVNDMLLLEEAKRRQIGPEEIIRSEISDKVRSPTEEEVAKFYNDNKARISGDLNSVRNQIANYLQEQSRQRLEQELSDRLRTSANIRWLISEPTQPVQNISADDDPARGDANAPVTIVEFTDFQCPACAAMHPVLEEVLKSYGNKVRFVVRDFPLEQHEHARKAAEAANAAHAQGKFFEYAAVLFKNQKALDIPSLKKYASDLGLNRARFDAALDRGVYLSEIKKDLEDGEMYGVGSTPTIFINGVQLRTLSPEALREAIDRAVGNPGKSNSSQK